MPRSVIGATEFAALRGGFTLVELLVVLVIAAIVTGLVRLQLGAIGADEPERLVRQLEARLEAMCDSALLTGNARGLRLDRDGYDFWRRDSGRWLRAEQPAAFDWPEALSVRIEIDGLDAASSAPEQPQILCTGLEPATPFRLQLRRGERQAELVWPR